MNQNSRMPSLGGVERTSVVERKGRAQRAGVYRAALLSAAFAAISLGVVGRAAAESPLGCTDAATSVSVTPNTSAALLHGAEVCYGVCFGAQGAANPCDIANLNADLVLPNGIHKRILTNVTIQANFIVCCSKTNHADPRCNQALADSDYCYTVNHADEATTFNSCPPVKVGTSGKVVAYTEGAGNSLTPNNDQVSPCSTANNPIKHACCNPCTGGCTNQLQEVCVSPRTYNPIKSCQEGPNCPLALVCLPAVPPCEAGQECSQITGLCVNKPDPPLSTFCELQTPPNLCTPEHCNGQGACVTNGLPVTCLGPVPPCEAGQRCEPTTGLCVNLPDPQLSTFCELQTPPNLCTPEHCNGQGACVPNGLPVSCLGPVPPCEAGQRCEPTTGLCVNLTDPVRSTPCQAETPDNVCTIDHCDGAGACVQLSTVCLDNPNRCNDNNVCTLDTCDINRPPTCCRNANIPCPNIECKRFTGVCNPGPPDTRPPGCQYTDDCRNGTNCCRDDGNPCTLESCNQDTGLCRRGTVCDNPNFCNDNRNCTIDTCNINLPGCCDRAPLCTGECFKEAPCSNSEVCVDAAGCQGVCMFTAAGDKRCFTSEFGCDQPECTSDDDCDPGFACSDTCCGLQCAPLCGNPFPATAIAPELATGTSSNNKKKKNAAGDLIDGPICCADGPEGICNDNDLCTDDLCLDGCCAHRPTVCPPDRCHIPFCDDPQTGCNYRFDCRTEEGCCPDEDKNPCTHEFCNEDTGFCDYTPDCTETDLANCDDGRKCTVETCINSCCRHRPLCSEDECFKGEVCDFAQICARPDGCQGACFHTAAGPTKCFAGEFTCGQSCASDNDCGLGEACSATCLGLQCAPLCGNQCPGAGAAVLVGTSGSGNTSGIIIIPEEQRCCADGASCDDEDPCTDDECIDGCCEYRPHVCLPRTCYNVVGCDPSTGCIYEPVACEGINCTFNPEAPECCDCGCGEDIGCNDGPICRRAANKCDIAECCNEKVNEGVPRCPLDATYDLNGDGIVDKFDFSLFAECWLLCPIHKDYEERCCDKANFVHCGGIPLPYPLGTWCVGTEDFAYFMTALGKSCSDPFIKTPAPCCYGRNAASESELPPLPTEAMLIEFGLKVPPADWEGYQTGALPVSPEVVVPEQPVQQREVKETRTARPRSPR